MEELYGGFAFDVMDYVVQEIKTEMVNERNEKKLHNLIDVLRALTVLAYDQKVVLFYNELANEYMILTK